MNIKFKLILFIENLVTNNIDSISKNITKRNIELKEDEIVELDSKEITKYFTKEINKYKLENNISIDEILIDGYEVKSLTENVNVYFRSEDIKTFSLCPSLMATLKHKTISPLLSCEQINDTTVKWSWTGTNNAYYLIDTFTQKVVEHLPINVNEYLETSLEKDKTYNRYLIAYDEQGEAVRSNKASITLHNDEVPSIFTKFTLPKRIEIVERINTDVATRMEAFQSGIGDYNDCKIYKPNNTSYKKSFKLLNKIYGIRASEQVKHHTVKFFYRYELRAKTDYLTYDSKVTVRVKAREITPIKDGFNGEVIGDPITTTTNLTYVFDDYTQVADIYMYQLIPELKINDLSKRFRYEIEVSNIKGGVRIYSYKHGYRDFIEEDNETDNYVMFEEDGYYDHRIRVRATQVKRSKDYIETFPSYNRDALVGAVNGDFEISPTGKKDMIDTLPLFETSTDVYDKKYYCIVEKNSPKEASVSFEFENQVEEEDYTLKNGDTIRFYSDSIIADETEYKDFITQVDKGDFVISDNRKHDFMYMIDETKIDISKYKRFELLVTPSISDIVILDYPVNIEIENGQIKTEIHVSLRALQSAISKWHPTIHNGYYYYNQEEYYLYNKSNLNGKDKIKENIFYKPNVSIKVTVDVAEPPGPTENYDITKSTKKELLLNNKLFEFKDNMLWPKPINKEVDYYFDFLEEYVYETLPFVFDKKPTRINSITWDQVALGDNKVECYYIAYNDIYGEWMPEIQLEHNKPIPRDIPLAKVFKLKYILKPSRKPRLMNREFLYSCESDWRNLSDHYLCNNYYIREETLMPLSYKTNGYYITKIIDLGETSDKEEEEENLRYVMPIMKYDGDVEFYMQDDDKMNHIEGKFDAGRWSKIKNGLKVKTRRLVRIKIVLKPGSKLYNLKLRVGRYEYTGMNVAEYLPAIGNINTKAIYSPTDTLNRYENIISYPLPFDMKFHNVIDDVEEYMTNLASVYEFDITNIKYINFVKLGTHTKDYNVFYQGINEVRALPLKAQSLKIIEDEYLKEANQEGVKFKVDPTRTIKINPIPQQFSPVIIYEKGINEPYEQVFFLDKFGGYSLVNTEEFESLGFKTLYLKRHNIDLETIKVYIDNLEYKNFKVIDCAIEFDKEIPAGSIIKVNYKILNSYTVVHDYEKDEVIIKLHKTESKKVDEVTVFYETHKTSSIRELDHLSMNPIYNATYNGYFYISDYTLEAFNLKIYPSTDLVFANGKDQIAVLVKVTDKYDNPVQGIDVNIISVLGKIVKVNEKTDINGIIKCMYTSWTGDCVDVIKAIANEDAKDEVKIINRKI